MILIADSSALIALAHCDCLEILETLFGEIKVPEAVYKEVIYESKPESEKLKKFLFQKIEIINIQDYLILEGWKVHLEAVKWKLWHCIRN